MKTKDLKVGDRVKVTNSISGRIIKITANGWVHVCWRFVNDGSLITQPETSVEIDGFRAKDIEAVL